MYIVAAVVAEAMGQMVVALAATAVVSRHGLEPGPEVAVMLLRPTRAKGIDTMIIGDFHQYSNNLPLHGATVVQPAVKMPVLCRSISFDTRSAATLPF